MLFSFLITCVFQEKQLSVQSRSVDLCTENRVIILEENWNLQANAVFIFNFDLSAPRPFKSNHANSVIL